MVGKQGKHMARVWEDRRRKELEKPIEKRQPKVVLGADLLASEEKTIRGIVKVWDTELILKWLQLHPDVVERARIVFPNDEEGLKITSKIRCDTEVDISDRRFKRTLKELLIMEGKV
jgi:hypothetical protein